jgi:hypothetical protein
MKEFSIGPLIEDEDDDEDERLAQGSGIRV